MYNIAIFNSKNQSILMSRELRIIEIADENELFHQLNFLDGIVINCSKEGDPNKLLSLLLAIKRQRVLPIWIREESGDELIRKLTIELGVLANFDAAVMEEELVCMMKNTLDLIHRRNQAGTKKETKYSDKTKLNALNQSIMIPDKSEVHLTQLEYKLLSLLSSRANQAHDYEAIYNHVWFSDSREKGINKKYRTANLVFHIRNKLKEHGVNPNILRTVRSVGYLLDTNMEKSSYQ